MVKNYSETQNESDGGLEESSEKVHNLRNIEFSIQNPDKQLEFQGGHENSEKQLELQEKYDFAIKEGFNAVATIQNQNAFESRSQTSSSTITDEDVGSECSAHAETSVVEANTPGMCKPGTINEFHISESRDILIGDVVNNNSVIVNVVEHKSSQGSPQEESVENGQKKFGNIGKLVAGTVVITLILVIIVVVVEIAQLQYSNSGETPTCADLPLVFGSRYIDRKNWFARSTEKKLHKFTTLPLSMVVIDTTGSFSCTDHFYCPNAVLEIQNRDIASGLVDDIKANFVLAEDGYIYEGRGWDYVGQNVPGHDEQSIEIMIMGNFAAEFPKCSNVSLPLLLDQGVLRGILAPDYKIYGKQQFYESGWSNMKPTSPLVKDMEKWAKWSPTTYG